MNICFNEKINVIFYIYIYNIDVLQDGKMLILVINFYMEMDKI